MKTVLAGITLALVAAGAFLPSADVSAQSALTRSLTGRIWSMQVTNINGMTQQDYDTIASIGANAVELQLFWSDIEPSPGTFDFSTLDANVRYAQAAGLRVIFIFWYSPFDPSWITSYELNSQGKPVNSPGFSCPPWWNTTDMDYYIGYVNATISRYLNDPDFLGAYVNYGLLDSYWDGGGYSPASEAAFRSYLQQEYGTISSLNSAWGTSYGSFSDITPPASPGQTGWMDFEQFRIWSVNYTLNKIYSTIYPEMREHGKTIFIYWGGDVSNSWDLINYPDVVFWLAKRYDAIVNLDTNAVTHLAKVFADMAEAYGVRLVQEWTPPPDSQAYDAVFEQSTAHAFMGLPYEVGYDFFAYPPNWCVQTVPIYSSLISSFPSQRFEGLNSSVAALFDFYAETATGEAGQQVSALDYLIYDYVPFKVITDYEVEEGLVNLSHFKYVVDLGGYYGTQYMPASVNRALEQWVERGGTVLRISGDGELYPVSSSAASAYLPPVSLPTYVSVNVPFQDRLQSLEITPLVNRTLGDALLVLDAVQDDPGGGGMGVNGQVLGNVPKEISVSVNASALALTKGPYYVVNLSDASLVAGPVAVSNGSLSFELPISVPQVDCLEIAPLSLVRGIRALSLSASRTSGLVGSTVSFTVSSSGPFGKTIISNATLYVNGRPTAQGPITLNSSGTYLVYAYYDGNRSSVVVVSVVAYSFSTYVAAQLWWLMIVVLLALVLGLFAAGMYYKARRHRVTKENKQNRLNKS